jgi:hypothetical protein
VTFTAPGHTPLVQEIPVTLRDSAARAHAAGRKPGRGRERGKRRVIRKSGAQG